MIKVSAPGKVHLLGEHVVVYGKPAILATINLRVTVTLKPLASVIARNAVTKQSRSEQIPTKIASLNARNDNAEEIQKVIEPIIKRHLKIKTIPPYQLNISSQIPIGAGLGSSAAVSAAYIAALLSFLKVKWDLNLINTLAYEAEKVFHGNPSGGDNSTVCFGGLVWFRKETPNLRIIQPLQFTIPSRMARNFILINTGTPTESTKDMVEAVKKLYDNQPKLVGKFLEDQETLVRQLLPVIKESKEGELIRIISDGEKNLESIGVVSSSAKSIIRKIEKVGGAAKICGAGGKTKATGILLAYHPKKLVVEKIAKDENLPYFSTTLGVEGVKMEKA